MGAGLYTSMPIVRHPSGRGGYRVASAYGLARARRSRLSRSCSTRSHMASPVLTSPSIGPEITRSLVQPSQFRKSIRRYPSRISADICRGPRGGHPLVPSRPGAIHQNGDAQTRRSR